MSNHKEGGKPQKDKKEHYICNFVILPVGVALAVAFWAEYVWGVFCCCFKEPTPEERRQTNLAAALRRMCAPKKNGRLNVPEWVHQEFMKGGTARQSLLKQFLDCDGHKAS